MAATKIIPPVHLTQPIQEDGAVLQSSCTSALIYLYMLPENLRILQVQLPLEQISMEHQKETAVSVYIPISFCLLHY